MLKYTQTTTRYFSAWRDFEEYLQAMVASQNMARETKLGLETNHVAVEKPMAATVCDVVHTVVDLPQLDVRGKPQ